MQHFPPYAASGPASPIQPAGLHTSTMSRSFLSGSTAFRPSVAAAALPSSPSATVHRQSHTANLHAFDSWVSQLRLATRDPRDPSFNARPWNTMRAWLSGFTEPLAIVPPTPTPSYAPSSSVYRAFRARVMASAQVHPINVFGFDENSRNDVITELIYAAKEGMVRVRYSVECLNCKGSADVVDHIDRLTATTECVLCHHLNKTAFLEHVKVLFTFHPDIFYAPMLHSQCKISKFAKPQTRLLRFIPAVDPPTSFVVTLGAPDGDVAALPAGCYRMRCPINGTDNTLLVASDAVESDEVHHVDIPVIRLRHRRNTEIQIPHGKLSLNITPDSRSMFALWIMAEQPAGALEHVPRGEAAPFLSLATLICHSAYQHLPANNERRPMPPMVMKHVTIVATSFGDPPRGCSDWEAYQWGKTQYDAVSRPYRRHGRVLQSSSEGVVAAFANAEHVLPCVIEALTRYAASSAQAIPGLRTTIDASSAHLAFRQGAWEFDESSISGATRLLQAAKDAEIIVSAGAMDDPRFAQAAARLVSSDGATEEHSECYALRCVTRSELVRYDAAQSQAPVLVSRLRFQTNQQLLSAAPRGPFPEDAAAFPR
jgi:hypothetical protein